MTDDIDHNGLTAKQAAMLNPCRCVAFAREVLESRGHLVVGPPDRDLWDGKCGLWIICADHCDTRARILMQCGEYGHERALALAYQIGAAFDRHKDPFFLGNKHPWKGEVHADLHV